RPEPRDFALDERIGGMGEPIGAPWRIFRPVGRSHALDPAAFLIDEDRRVRPPDGFPQSAAERRHLRRALDIALEENEAPRPRLLEEGGLVGGQLVAGAAGNKGAGGHLRALSLLS